MRVDHYPISRIFSHGGSIHYVLPPFQREYTWGKSEWDVLLKDAVDIYNEYSEDKEPEHFLGSIVVVDGGRVNGIIPVSILVDGQQRLTTMTILLCALRDISQSTVLAGKIQKIVINEDESGDILLKLLPTTKYNDREAYRNIVLKHQDNIVENSAITNAYHYFLGELERRHASGEIDIERFFIVLINCFQLVLIELNRDDSPYRIFESLNAKGKRLTQADLVRNYIAMKLPFSKQDEVFFVIWGPIENMLQENRTVFRLGELTAFIRHYLVLKTAILCSEEHIYARFRDRMEKEFSGEKDFIQEIETLKKFATYYDHLLHPETESNVQIQERLRQLTIMEISTAYPYLLAAYDAWTQQEIQLDDFIFVLDMLENYMVRRYLAGEQTNYLNKMFPALWREIKAKAGELSFKEAVRTVFAAKN